MRDPSRSTVPDLHISAPVKVRTWRQVLIGTIAAKDQIAGLQKSGGLFTATVNSETLSTLRPNALHHRWCEGLVRKTAGGNRGPRRAHAR